MKDSRLLEVRLPRLDEPMTELIAAARNVHECGDYWASSAKKEAALRGKPITCDGCRRGYCCQQPVLCTPPDAFPIALKLDQEGKNDRAYRRFLRDCGRRQEEAMERGTQDEAKNRCPFLSLDHKNECEIYDIRPFPCRIYLVISSSDDCQPYVDRSDGLRPKSAVVNNVEIQSFVLSNMLEFSEELGWPRAPYIRSLPTMVATWLTAAVAPITQFWGIVQQGATLDLDVLERMSQKRDNNPWMEAL